MKITGNYPKTTELFRPAQELDYESMYPTCMSKSDALWPIYEGDFEYLENLDHLTFGIYRVEIEGQPEKKKDEKCTRIFRYNPEKYYTHYDIERARDLGLKVKLINESPNALIFSKNNCMSVVNELDPIPINSV
ncbi:hypothetical protein C1646_809781 [Rhizophagus diaphanus]|nr:hypothetical protein C1646_809781 [Rhizophagus diaphanus] [Rhizophagus sp. MUCL 43196]